MHCVIAKKIEIIFHLAFIKLALINPASLRIW
jgi:hypothetical protein